MKTATKALCALVLASAVVSLSAEEKTSQTKPQTKPETPAQTKLGTKPVGQPFAVTGSYIPQRPDLHGHIAITTSPLVVVDSDMLRRSGAHDVADALRRGGWTH
jgi:hypothetical protein